MVEVKGLLSVCQLTCQMHPPFPKIISEAIGNCQIGKKNEVPKGARFPIL